MMKKSIESCLGFNYVFLFICNSNNAIILTKKSFDKQDTIIVSIFIQNISLLSKNTGNIRLPLRISETCKYSTYFCNNSTTKIH